MEKWTAPRFRTVADRYLRAALKGGSKPNVTELAANAGMSAADFSNLFFRVVRLRPSEYLKRGQIERSKRLLLKTDARMNQIAYKCGFGTRRSFFRAFKRATGVTPARWRRSALFVAR